jgi:hypothetical protein
MTSASLLMGDYLLSSCFSALTAFVMMGQLNSVKANYAQSYVLVAVLACFLGGVDPFGGAGRLSGMIQAVIILQIISSGVNLLRVDPFFVTAMWGGDHPGADRGQPLHPPLAGGASAGAAAPPGRAGLGVAWPPVRKRPALARRSARRDRPPSRRF